MSARVWRSSSTRSDRLSQLIGRSNTQTVRIADLRLSFSGLRQRIVPVVVEMLDFQRTADGSMQIDGVFSIDGQSSQLHLRADRESGRITTLNGSAVGLPLSAFLHRNETPTELAFGVTSSADLTIKATRASENAPPALQLNGRSNDGAFDAGGVHIGTQTFRAECQL